MNDSTTLSNVKRDTINCQSGGTLNISNNGCNMKVQMIVDALKEYLTAGKNEQKLIDFLERN